MVSHSPPVFSHSPPSAFLSDYSASNYSRLYESPIRSCRPQVLTPPQARKVYPIVPPLKMPPAPKSCLVQRSPEELPVDPQSPVKKENGKTKKKVIFADDQGLSLTQVKIMSEPSNLPPVWSLNFLAQITQGLVSPVPSEQWTVDFRQPASDYLEFRRKIDEKNVSLENVIVKENESIIVGTVKVKNISFHKEVVVRATWDNWSTQEDIFCTYSQIYGPSAAYVLYDTFSFKITLPPNSRKLEFCICFKADGKEFWDNNEKKNYTLSKRSPYKNVPEPIPAAYQKNSKNTNSSEPITIPARSPTDFGSKIPTWSEFSSWNQNEYPCPYW
uniref:Protein phosphatase 1 regulatory subunit n=1 Tax=Tabanus bromius TaxID=304241 RepID=A0A0K8TSP0_TABBR